jgi:tellurite resistance protein TerC
VSVRGVARGSPETVGAGAASNPQMADSVLGVHLSAHTVTAKEAAAWSAVWVALALVLNFGVYHFYGPRAGLEFLIEIALSVDNIFVFLVFSSFACPPGISTVCCSGVCSGRS